MDTSKQKGKNLTRDQEEIVSKLKKFLANNRDQIGILVMGFKKADRGGQKGYIDQTDIYSSLKEIGFNISQRGGELDNLCLAVGYSNNNQIPYSELIEMVVGEQEADALMKANPNELKTWDSKAVNSAKSEFKLPSRTTGHKSNALGSIGKAIINACEGSRN